jgi:alpha-galactosidase
MEKKTGRNFRLAAESDLERSVAGADFVVTSISVGGLAAMSKDLAIPEKYGVFATVGDTVGPGGFARLLRNVPVFRDLAQRIERVAPSAWLINISNPLTPITKLLSETTSLKTVGLCFGIINHLWVLQDLLGFDDLSEVAYTVAGIDHCSWFLDLNVRGKDVYPQLRAMTVEALERLSSFSHSKDEWARLDSLTAGFTLFKRLGYLPAISDRHVGEFFRFFLSGKEKLKRYHMIRTTIAHRAAWAADAKRRIESVLRGEEPLEIVKTRDIVVDVINALAGSGRITTTVNFRNEGQIANLPRGPVVETLAAIDTDRIAPIPAGPLPDELLSIIQPHLVRQELALQAATEGSRRLFVAALTSDPSVPDIDAIEAMAEELLEAHRDVLPQFFGEEDTF